jgi:hypothetical protein
MTTAPTAPSRAVPAGTLVMVIRHGEKPDGSGTGIDARGVDARGEENDHASTRTGWERAYRLVDLFDPDTGPPRPALARPAATHAAGPNENGEGLRTRDTVMPPADPADRVAPSRPRPAALSGGQPTRQWSFMCRLTSL